MTTIIITMAGFGRRFLDAGYSLPKYRIEAHGRSLFAWSMLSLRNFTRAGARFVFVVRKADEASQFIAAECSLLGILKFDVVEIEAPTDGQATTALLAAPAIGDMAEPMLIYNIDTFVHPDSLPADAARGDGWVPCFDAVGDHWSFALADASGRISEVREKVRISRHATVGLYWFSSFELFRQTYDAFYLGEGRHKAAERYVAPMYNSIIDAGRPVYVFDIPLDSVIPLGVPDEVKAFQGVSAPIVG